MTIAASTASLSLAGKTAVVTGGGTGIGKGIALEFARAGAEVAIAGRRPGVLNETAGEIRALGRRALAVPTDVTRREEVERLIASATEAFGGIGVSDATHKHFVLHARRKSPTLPGVRGLDPAVDRVARAPVGLYRGRQSGWYRSSTHPSNRDEPALAGKR